MNNQSTAIEPSNAMEDIDSKIQEAFSQLGMIQDTQTIFIDRMLGAAPQVEPALETQPPEGRVHQVIEMIRIINEKLGNIRVEQARLTEIVNL